MPIRTFDGNTFLAFIDISGLKIMSEREALDNFYTQGYRDSTCEKPYFQVEFEYYDIVRTFLLS